VSAQFTSGALGALRTLRSDPAFASNPAADVPLAQIYEQFLSNHSRTYTTQQQRMANLVMHVNFQVG
jgi:hypothetical protein